jgi:hypothetical protein
MRPINEYPKEELEELINAVSWFSLSWASDNKPCKSLEKWHSRIREAISDQDFKEKDLPFKTE